MKTAVIMCAAALAGCASRPVAKRPLEEVALSDVIEDRIEADERIEGAQIDASTDDGVVVLAGTVQSERDATLAGRIAAGTPGVVAVLNELRIEDELDDPPMDPIYDEGVGEQEDSTESMMDPSL